MKNSCVARSVPCAQTVRAQVRGDSNVLTRVPRLTANPPARLENEKKTVQLARRSLIAAGLAGALSGVLPGSAVASDVVIVNEVEGFGTRAVQKGDLVFVHYVGTLPDSGAVFDSTRGGQAYRDGGPGVFRPMIVKLGADPVPGVVTGLSRGIEGMRVGGKRSVVVPPELGFGGANVLAPYAAVPPNSTLKYEIELLRVSTTGPDALMKGVIRCGLGSAAQQDSGCRNIEPAEFLR